MKIKRTIQKLLLGVGLVLLGLSDAMAVTVVDNFTGASASYNWQPIDGACLTAGDGTGPIPACAGLSYYGSQTQVGGYTGTLPDAVGYGALRLTNGNPNFHQDGAIVSNQTYNMSQGVQATFTTVSYRGNSGGSGRDGADGISF